MDRIKDILAHLRRRRIRDTWYAITEAPSFAEYISVRRGCCISPVATFHALLRVGPWIRSDLFKGAPWRAVSAELVSLGYRR